MKKILFLFLCILLSSKTFAASDIFHYISPGLTIAYSSHKAWVIGYKVSIGFIGNNMKILDDRFFYNFTFGQRASERHSEKKTGYFFTEFETGAIQIPYLMSPLCIPGIGIGAAFRRNSDKQIIVRPKGSAFIGSVVLFLRSDFVFDEDGFLYDIGGCLTAPIFPWIFSPGDVFFE